MKHAGAVLRVYLKCLEPQINSLRRLGAGGLISGPFQDLRVGTRRGDLSSLPFEYVRARILGPCHLTRQYCPYTVEVIDWEWFITITGLLSLRLRTNTAESGS